MTKPVLSIADLSSSKERELLLTRIYDAPRDLVWQAWADPKHVARWWGPKGFTVPFCTMDFRPGGAYRVCMRSPEGRDYWVRGIYREIAPPEQIVFSWSHEDENGDLAHETLVTVTLADQAGKTKLTLQQARFESKTSRDEHHTGWADSLDCLDEYLKPKQSPLETP